jgi:hypothetical protein
MCGVLLMKIYTFLEGTKLNGIYNYNFLPDMVEIEVSEEELNYLEKNILAAYYENGKVVYKGLEQIKQRQANEKEKADILQWLADNDWKINKVVVGEWEVTDLRWTNYIKERQEKRKRLDEL